MRATDFQKTVSEKTLLAYIMEFNSSQKINTNVLHVSPLYFLSSAWWLRHVCPHAFFLTYYGPGLRFWLFKLSYQDANLEKIYTWDILTIQMRSRKSLLCVLRQGNGRGASHPNIQCFLWNISLAPHYIETSG